LELARQTLGSVQQLYGLNKSTFDAGTTTELDLRTAETQVLTARVNMLTYEREVAQAGNMLALLVGHPLPQHLPAGRPLSAGNVMSHIPAGLPSDLLQRRPDILQAEHTLKAANANIGAARAAFFPVISLTGSAGSSSAELAQLFGKGTGSWSFSPQISVPLFTGGLNRANLDVAKIGARIEVANYEKAIQTAFREVADSLVARGSYARQVEAQEALVKAQQRRYTLAEARYRQGVDTYLNVLSAQQDLYGAQRSLIDLQFESLSNHVTLYKALGGGWK
jgi:multidrug efflux system outer membrane protein